MPQSEYRQLYNARQQRKNPPAIAAPPNQPLPQPQTKTDMTIEPVSPGGIQDETIPNAPVKEPDRPNSFVFPVDQKGPKPLSQAQNLNFDHIQGHILHLPALQAGEHTPGVAEPASEMSVSSAAQTS